MRPAIQAFDEFVHELGEGPDALESFCFGLYDPSGHLGAIARMQSRPFDGTVDVVVACFLPDGTTAVAQAMSTTNHSDLFSACGAKLEIIRPLEEVVLNFNGPAMLIDDPLVAGELWEPSSGSGLSGRSEAECDISLAFTATVPPIQYDQARAAQPSSPRGTEGRYDPAGAIGAYQLFGRALGHIKVGTQLWLVDTNAVRSHVWEADLGPRALPRRWITASSGPALSISGRVQGETEGQVANGFAWDGTSLHQIDHLQIQVSWSGTHSYPDVLQIESKFCGSSLNFTGKVISMLPLEGKSRHGTATRVVLGLARWNWPDGRIGYGIVEFEDSLVGW